MTMTADMAAGFADSGASAQTSFRAVMDAMARPGSIQRIAATCGQPQGLMHGSAALALTLFDQDTPIWLDAQLAATPDVAAWLSFHTGAPRAGTETDAMFALIASPASPHDFERFAQGSSDYPDRSTTLVVQIDSLIDGVPYELRGPGIDGVTLLRATHTIPDLPERLARNATLFPCGVDLVLVADDRVVAIPRTTRLVAKEG